jgi:ABC-type cobalamin/Fe3+-siderophores transport system ATPase subunit
MSEDRFLQGTDIRFGFSPSQPVLHGVSIEGIPGKLSCILGPNGSGKTTLFRCLLGWLRPSGGSVVVRGKPIKAYPPKSLARIMAYVPQIPVSSFAFTVQDLVLMGRYAHAGVLGLAGEHDLSVARAAMEMTETTAFARRTLNELSGGEAQRVMIARALAQQPSVMLLDEPTSHLDIRNQLMIYQMMARLAHDWGMAVLCVSHDINLAARFADSLVLMREGKVLASGEPEQVITEAVLRDTYDVEVKLVPVPGETVPMVLADGSA